MTTKKLPKNWTECKLGDVVYIKNGYAFKSKAFNQNGVPIVRISDINNGTVNTTHSVATVYKTEYAPFIIGYGDLLIAMSGATTGKMGIYISKSVALQNQRIGNIKIISNEILDNQFRNYLLEDLTKLVFKLAYGGAQPNISSSEIENITISLPPLNEQKRIVEKIEKLFKQIDSSAATLQKTQEKISQFRDVIIRKQIFVPRKDFHYKQYPLGEALIYEQPTKYIVKSTKYNDSYKTPVLTPGKSFIKGYTNETFGIFEKDLPVIIFDDFTTANKFVTFPFKVKSSAMKILHMNKEIADIKYMFYILSQIKSTKGTHKRYWISEYAQKLFNLPSLPEQRKIVAEIEKQFAAADKMQKAVDNALENAKRLKQAILKKAFNGELVPQDPKDEPAAALLAKIKAEREASKHNLKQSKRIKK